MGVTQATQTQTHGTQTQGTQTQETQRSYYFLHLIRNNYTTPFLFFHSLHPHHTTTFHAPSKQVGEVGRRGCCIQPQAQTQSKEATLMCTGGGNGMLLPSFSSNINPHCPLITSTSTPSSPSSPSPPSAPHLSHIPHHTTFFTSFTFSTPSYGMSLVLS